MKTTWTLIFLIATFWLTLFLSNVELAKKETAGSSFQIVVDGPLPNRMEGWHGDGGSGFVFRTLSEKDNRIQIVLGLGSFELYEANCFQKKLQFLDTSNTNLRKI